MPLSKKQKRKGALERIRKGHSGRVDKRVKQFPRSSEAYAAEIAKLEELTKEYGR